MSSGVMSQCTSLSCSWQQSEVSLEGERRERVSSGVDTDMVDPALRTREEDIRNLVEILLSPTYRNALLIGDSAVDANSVVEDLASRLKTGLVPKQLAGLQFLDPKLSLSSISHCMSSLQMEQKLAELSKIVEECMPGGAILHIGDLQWLAELKKSSSDFCPAQRTAAELGNLLARHARLWFVGVVTMHTFARLQILHPSLAREWKLQSVQVTTAFHRSSLQQRVLRNRQAWNPLPVRGSSPTGASVPVMQYTSRYPGNTQVTQMYQCCADCLSKFEEERRQLCENESLPLQLAPNKWLSSNDKLTSGGPSQMQNPPAVQQVAQLSQKWQNFCRMHHGEASPVPTRSQQLLAISRDLDSHQDKVGFTAPEVHMQRNTTGLESLEDFHGSDHPHSWMQTSGVIEKSNKPMQKWIHDEIDHRLLSVTQPPNLDQDKPTQKLIQDEFNFDHHMSSVAPHMFLETAPGGDETHISHIGDDEATEPPEAPGSFPGSFSKGKSPSLPRRRRGARYSIQTRTQLNVLDDGYKWRKYGQKVVKNSPHPRDYYRCSTPKCPVRKLVHRSIEDPGILRSTYVGTHTHPSPMVLDSSHISKSFDHFSPTACVTTLQRSRTLSELMSQSLEIQTLSIIEKPNLDQGKPMQKSIQDELRMSGLEGTSKSLLKGKTSPADLGSRSDAKVGESQPITSSSEVSEDDDQEHQNDDAALGDIKRKKRMLSNRKLARRSRMRKQAYLSELEMHKAQLRAENNMPVQRFQEINYKFQEGEVDNRVLKAYCKALRAENKEELHLSKVGDQDTTVENPISFKDNINDISNDDIMCDDEFISLVKKRMKAMTSIQIIDIEEAFSKEHSFDNQATIVLGLFDATSNNLEFYFESGENMAKLVGVGLHHAKVIVKLEITFEVQEVEMEKWEKLWHEVKEGSLKRCKIMKVRLPQISGPIKSGDLGEGRNVATSSSPINQDPHTSMASNYALQVPYLWEISKFFIMESVIDASHTKCHNIMWDESIGAQCMDNYPKDGNETNMTWYRSLKVLFSRGTSNRNDYNQSHEEMDQGEGHGNGDENGGDGRGVSNIDMDVEDKETFTQVNVILLSGGDFFEKNLEPLSNCHRHPISIERLENVKVTPELTFGFHKLRDSKKIQITTSVVFALDLDCDSIESCPHSMSHGHESCGHFGWFHDELYESLGPIDQHIQRTAYLKHDFKEGDHVVGKTTSRASTSKDIIKGKEKGYQTTLVVGNSHVARVALGVNMKRQASCMDHEGMEQSIESNCNLTEGGFKIQAKHMMHLALLQYKYLAPYIDIIAEQVQERKYRYDLINHPVCNLQKTRFLGTWLPTGNDEVATYAFKANRKLHEIRVIEEETLSTGGSSGFKTLFKKRNREYLEVQIRSSLEPSLTQAYEKQLYVNHAMSHLVDGQTYTLIESSPLQNPSAALVRFPILVDYQ